jgi:hypothetical protein
MESTNEVSERCQPCAWSHLDAFDANEVVVPHALIAIGVPEDSVLVTSGVTYRQLIIRKNKTLKR